MKLCAFADEASAALGGQITALRRNGIPMLEIRGVDGENIKDISPAKAKEARRMLDDAGISVWSIGSPMGKYPLGEDFAPHLSDFCYVTELAEILGASRIRMFSFYPEASAERARTETAVYDRLTSFCERSPAGIVLCHENEKEIFGEDTASCLWIHQNFPAIRAVFDPANFVQCGVDTLQAWDALAPYIDYMHVKDADRDGVVVPAGMGMGNLPALLRRYREAGGEVLTLEPHLTAFTGLDKLENGKSIKTGVPVYKNNDEAFAAAASALRGLLDALGQEA